MLTLVVSLMGFASAYTLIAGKIYNADFTETIEGADVFVSCTHDNVTTVMNTTSLADGSYGVQYTESGTGSCDNGDFLIVDASHIDFGFGSSSGEINDDVIGTWDLAVVNVPLVPEFGTVVGMLTIISAVGIFFVVRRE